MISIRSCYHPIDAAILWCNLADHEDEIRRVDLSHPGSLLRHFPQWPFLHIYAECIYDAIASGELPASCLGHPINLDNQGYREYWTIRRADLLIWFARNYPDERPAFLFPQTLDHLNCVSLNAYLVQEAELDAAQRTIAKLRDELAALAGEVATLTVCKNELTARLEAMGIPSELSEDTHNMLMGAMLEVTVGKSKEGRTQSIYKSQSALVEEITRRFPKLSGLSKSTIDRRFADARRLITQAKRG
ncbi:hypothetical protein [Pseudomonas capeferrum]|uniref:hypothetical protein n=1 Tax=Pseudomonas capeferrum TaxID=1495066 RepID=UPI0030D7812F